MGGAHSEEGRELSGPPGVTKVQCHIPPGLQYPEGSLLMDVHTEA